MSKEKGKGKEKEKRTKSMENPFGFVATKDKEGEIEREAKIDRYGCAYYRRCNGPGCSKVEQNHGEFRHCGKCSVVFYCGAECQKTHWKTGSADRHKVMCGKGHGPIGLPGQEAMFKKKQALNHSLRGQMESMAGMAGMAGMPGQGQCSQQ